MSKIVLVTESLVRSYLRKPTKTLIDCVQRNMASATLFQGVGDQFRGITVHSNIEQCNSTDFPKKLEESIKYWKLDDRRTVWFKVFLEHSHWVPLLAQKGFKYHHAKEDYVMMYLWLPKNETSNIPSYAHTLVGVGGIVVNEKSQVLAVKEKYATRVAWKLPGGYLEPGENLVDAAIREVLEETNITTEFQSVIAFRHAHGRVFDCSDIYVVVSLKPSSTKIEKSDQEIAECVWMNIQEYLNHPEIHSLNKLLLEKYLEYKNKKISINCMNGVHDILKVPFTFYYVKDENSLELQETLGGS